MERQSKLVEVDISTEKWREYDFGNRVYRVNSPKTLFYRLDGNVHHIIDTLGVEHTMPAPGINGCLLRTKETSVKEDLVK